MARKTTRKAAPRKTAAAKTPAKAAAKPAAKPAAKTTRKKITKETHPAADPTNVKKRISARAELKAIRQRLADMNSTQLQQFFGGFNDKDLNSFAKALNKLEEKQKDRAIKARQKQIEKLQEEIAQLNAE